MKKYNKNKRVSRGFTLLELMVVLAIIGILAAVIAPNLMDNADKAKVTKAKADIAALKGALDQYKLDNNSYPSTDQGLRALIAKPTIGKIPQNYKANGYLSKPELPKDPWGNDYNYVSPGAHGAVDVMSYGADGKQGGEGFDADIGSWQAQ